MSVQGLDALIFRALGQARAQHALISKDLAHAQLKMTCSISLAQKGCSGQSLVQKRALVSYENGLRKERKG